MMATFTTLLLTLIATIDLTTASCYTPNGTDINAYNNVPDLYLYAPCNKTAKVSMCCAIGPGRGDDHCFADGSGLCWNPAGANGTINWRESCTDPTWRDPACVRLFIHPETSESTPHHYLVDDKHADNSQNGAMFR